MVRRWPKGLTRRLANVDKKTIKVSVTYDHLTALIALAMTPTVKATVLRSVLFSICMDKNVSKFDYFPSAMY